jgi:hypothetical protein
MGSIGDRSDVPQTIIHRGSSKERKVRTVLRILLRFHRSNESRAVGTDDQCSRGYRPAIWGGLGVTWMAWLDWGGKGRRPRTHAHLCPYEVTMFTSSHTVIGYQLRVSLSALLVAAVIFSCRLSDFPAISTITEVGRPSASPWSIGRLTGVQIKQTNLIQRHNNRNQVRPHSFPLDGFWSELRNVIRKSW